MWPMWDLSTTIQVWFGSFPNLTVQPLAGVGRTFVNATGRGAATCGSLKKSMVTGRCLKIETSSPLHGVFLCSVSTVSYIILLPEMTSTALCWIQASKELKELRDNLSRCDAGGSRGMTRALPRYPNIRDFLVRLVGPGRFLGKTIFEVFWPGRLCVYFFGGHTTLSVDSYL